MGELERAVMDRLWSADAARWFTVREVHEALAADRDIAYTTVMTVMDRLAKKSLVSQQRDGRAYRYRASASRGELTAELMRETLDEFAVDDRRTALVAFVGEASDEERAALRDALAALGEP
jgi:BlaI family transcriptional regulator, penicillinase repressor